MCVLVFIVQWSRKYHDYSKTGIFQKTISKKRTKIQEEMCNWIVTTYLQIIPKLYPERECSQTITWKGVFANYTLNGSVRKLYSERECSQTIPWKGVFANYTVKGSVRKLYRERECSQTIPWKGVFAKMTNSSLISVSPGSSDNCSMRRDCCCCHDGCLLDLHTEPDLFPVGRLLHHLHWAGGSRVHDTVGS